MNRFSYVMMASVIFSMCLAPAFAQTPQQFAVKDVQGGKSYPVNYGMTGGTVDDITISQQDTSLMVYVTATSDGTLTMTLPRTLIDAKNGASDDQFFVLVDGADTDFTENKTSTDRTLSVSIPADTTQVEIIGTQVVPEFGTLSSIILVVSILSIVAITAKTRLKFA